jgi:GT2 family glycosyltransferase
MTIHTTGTIPDMEIAVLIVCYNSAGDIEECLMSVLNSADDGIQKRIVVVDNCSTDGTAELVRKFDRVDLVSSAQNNGFTGGNNLGWRHICQRYPEVKYLCLLNPDTIVESGWLASLADFLNSNDRIGSVQSKIRLHPQTDKIASTHTKCHFLGFGIQGGYGQVDTGQFDQPRQVDFAHGAAMLIRASLLKQYGLFIEEMFLYLEDTELSWRIKQLGWEVWLVPQSVVYHKYVFSNHRYYYYFERNRWLLLFTYYKAGTFLLLAPALFLMELGQWFFALRNGLLSQKFRSCKYFFNPENRAELWQRRKAAQARRIISDRQFMADFTGRIDFSELDGGAALKIANRIFSAYWSVAKKLLFW